jgi:Ca-activated chloride channel family protein
MPLQWTVARKDDPDTLLFDAWTSNPVVPIEPGAYIVSVRGELLSASRTVTVRDNRPIAVPIVLGAGHMRVRVLTQRSNVPLTDAVVTVSTADGAPLAVFKSADAQALLPPGRYLVSAEAGLVRTEQAVTVAEGRAAQVDLALNVGRLELTALARKGAADSFEAPLFVIMEDDPPRGRREVARSAASQAEFVLPPGTYYVVARQGGVEARERLEIGPGDVVRRTVDVAVGRLALTTVAPGTMAGNAVTYTIKRIDDPGQDAIWTSRPAPILFLPAGRYRVEGRYGMTNLAAARDVEVKAGQMTQLPIEHQAATLRVRLTGIGAGLAEVVWEVRDQTGRTVWSSSQAEDTAVVQAGRYLVTADSNGRHDQRSVELRSGDSATVQVRAD